MMAMSKYPSMNWDAPDVADTFKLYRQRLLLVCEDNDETENERIARRIRWVCRAAETNSSSV